MCFFLYIASPLTLSEVRSMLPAGLGAHLAPSHRALLHRIHPSACTVARLLVGSCSCDLIRQRQPDSREDERELRGRYRSAGLARTEVIRALERHRRGPQPRPQPAAGWPVALAAFVVEHARNAGPTLYLLEFASDPDDSPTIPAPKACAASDVRDRPDRWLVEGSPVVVS